MRSLVCLSTLVALTATGCTISPNTLNAIAGQVNGNPTTPIVKPTPTPPGSTPLPAPTAPAATQEIDPAVEAFDAKLAAAESDPRAVGKLFLAGLVAYEKDAALGRALMTLAVIPGDVQPSTTSPSGLAFISPREIYFRTLDRNPALGRIYLDAPSAADGPDVETHVVIDEEYKAADIGINEAAGTAKFFFKLNELGAGKRSRPLSFKKVDGAWRVSEYSSVMVQI